MKKKIYIGGKITGLDPEKCFNNFLEQEQTFQKLGFEVVNPLRLHGINSVKDFHGHVRKTQEEYLKLDIQRLLECDYANFQLNSSDSPGALLEMEICKRTGIKYSLGIYHV